MTLLWPGALWLLLSIPALVAGYILLLRRQNKIALRYASLGLVKQAMDRRQGVRRHLPPALFLAALAVLLLSIARPAAIVTLPSERATIILTMDLSGSMRATDVDPTRIYAAQSAARAFVAAQPGDTKIGVVGFSSTAMLMQTPTLDRDQIQAAIDRFQPLRATAMGSGILVSLRAIFPEQDFDLIQEGPYYAQRGMALGEVRPAEASPVQPVAPGSYKSAAIVLLSDGRSTSGPDPVEAARLAADRGVRIFTVGFGTPEGADIAFDGRSVHVALDEETLKQIADMTHGTYSRAGSETDLKKIYQAITTQLIMERQKTEVTALLAAAAAILAVLAVLLSVLWFNRIA